MLLKDNLSSTKFVHCTQNVTGKFLNLVVDGSKWPMAEDQKEPIGSKPEFLKGALRNNPHAPMTGSINNVAEKGVLKHT